MTDAPLLHDLAEGPAGGEATFLTADDGRRIRVAHWAPSAASRGTVLLFPGRTEFIEKYGRVARDLTDAGYDTLAVDWRGQGASDRLATDPFVGHVDTFADYQRDVAAAVGWARDRKLPEPWYLIAHSMGGCIGLRALVEGLPVAATVFSAPMWGIVMAPYLRPLAATLPWAMRRLGRGETYVPGGAPANYVTETAFAENLLTTDEDHYAYFARHAQAAPDFGIGGPSINWLGEALTEVRALLAAPKPSVPSLVMLGTEEAIVSSTGIRRMVAGWPAARLSVIDGGKHELMMEAPGIRAAFMDQMFAQFEAAAPKRR